MIKYQICYLLFDVAVVRDIKTQIKKYSFRHETKTLLSDYPYFPNNLIEIIETSKLKYSHHYFIENDCFKLDSLSFN